MYGARPEHKCELPRVVKSLHIESNSDLEGKVVEFQDRMGIPVLSRKCADYHERHCYALESSLFF